MAKMISGFINVNKQAGVTSGRVVNRIKGIMRAQGLEITKIGHLGTLDPDGEGVLPIAIGRATRLFDLLTNKTKVYYTIFRFGETSDTLDASGTITETNEKLPTKEEILAIIPSLTGEIAQIPPSYSAKVINGERAYKLARKGETPDLKAKLIKIESIELIEQLNDREYAFRVTCGGGTYIRSIARDMASALGTVGLMSYIKREQSGAFDLTTAYTLDELQNDLASKILPLDYVLSTYPEFTPPYYKNKLVLDGVHTEIKNMPDCDFKLIIDGKLVGIAEKLPDNTINIKIRLL